MAKAVEEMDEVITVKEQPELDSKYRLIIIAAKRSKQLQRGARPRVDIDPQKHKPTRIALEEVERGLVPFSFTDDDQA